MNGVSFEGIAHTGGQYGFVPPLIFRVTLQGGQGLVLIISLSRFFP